MSKRMLIDASHPEETRVVVLDGNKVEDFDFESASRRPLKGNIYLAKVTRVEPSLQAAFVEYGGNRQGFLAFSEIHPDYYQIPIADRLALLAEQSRRLMDEDDDVDNVTAKPAASEKTAPGDEEDGAGEDETPGEENDTDTVTLSAEGAPSDNAEDDNGGDEPDQESGDLAFAGEATPEDSEAAEENVAATDSENGDAEPGDVAPGEEEVAQGEETAEQGADTAAEDSEPQRSQQMAESTGAPAQMERKSRRKRPPRRRQYKIQEVIRRKQIILIQVVKEERGNKGASVTTYLSLAGRYCVLMPNTPRGGGISRKITSLTDRKRLKSAAQSLELPEGMGLIIRTAGANRTKAEIRRDYDYLLRLWDSVRELTLKSNAPALVYEEGNLIKRSIRDLYGKEVSEVLVDGEAGYREAKDFMRMLMPSHAKNVKPYRDSLSLFQHHHVESQLDAMFSPTVTLKSGGYIVINQTEALVSVDVNSGKATKEHSIEDTAYKTNLEAADEIARQLRLRDLAGLVVIDFIDMEDGKNDRNVEKRLRDALRNDRARIQIGKISQFGLLEMSRQRLRAGVLAGSTVSCPHCEGLGYIRSTESAALQLLRALDEEAQSQVAESLVVSAPTEIIVYALNHKRAEISRIEQEFEMSVVFEKRDSMSGGTFEIERIGKRAPAKQVKRAAVTVDAGFQDADDEIEDVVEAEEADEETAPVAAESAPEQESGDEAGNRRRKRRRRRGGRGRNPQPQGDNETIAAQGESVPQDADEAAASAEPVAATEASPSADDEAGEKKRRRRRRGRRGRRRDHESPEGTAAADAQSPEASDTGESTAEDRSEQDSDVPDAAQPAFEVAVNAPSTPHWSFAGDEPVTDSAAEQDEADEESPEAAPSEPAPAPAGVQGESRPAPSSRKGWWQKRLGI